MQKHPPADTPEGRVSGEASAPWRLRLLRVAGGDAVFAEKLHEMLWYAYRAEDCPFGSSEEGMIRWLMGEPEDANPEQHVGFISDQTTGVR